MINMQRQREYERIFAIEYGKSIEELTDAERRSPILFAAHQRAVERLDRRTE